MNLWLDLWSNDAIVEQYMHKPSFLLWKHGSDSPPLNILGETSSALQVLLDRIKTVWIGAQGDYWVKGVNREWTPIDGSVSTQEEYTLDPCQKKMIQKCIYVHMISRKYLGIHSTLRWYLLILRN